MNDLSRQIAEKIGVVVQGGTAIFRNINIYLSPGLSPKQANLNHSAILKKMRTIWIEGVLDKSLQGKPPLTLEVEFRSNRVTSLWNPVRDYDAQPPAPPPKNTSVTDIFDDIGDGRTLLILGEPGAGKTTTLLQLARDFIERAKQGRYERIPIVLNLSQGMGENENIANWIIFQLKRFYEVPKGIAIQWVKEQSLLLLLDGLDEIRDDNKRNNCVAAINAFQQSQATEIVVCCRDTVYERLSNRLNFERAVYLKPLTLEQIQTYLSHLNNVTGLKTFLCENSSLTNLAQSPLMLNTMVISYEGVDVESMSDATSGEYRTLFNAYIERRFMQEGVGKQLGYKFLYQNHQTKLWLTWLAKKMPETLFKIEEIQPSWLSSKRDKTIYRITVGLMLGAILGIMSGIYFVYFYTLIQKDKLIPEVNISFQLLVTGMLSGLVAGVITGLLFLQFNRVIKGLISGGIFAISLSLFTSFIQLPHYPQLNEITPIYLSAILGGAIFSAADIEIKPVESVEFDLNKMFNYIIFFGVFGGLISSIGLYLESPEIFFEGRVYYALYVTAVFTLVGIFLGGFKKRKNSIDSQKAKPNQGIKRSLKYTMITFCSLFFSAMFVAWAVDFSFHWNSVLICIGLVVGLLGGLGANESSGVVCIQHFVLRLILFHKKHTPWNYERFLNYASERVFLNEVGGGYEFYGLLKNHFARIQEIDEGE
jgi:eukaryotic-like serine/threonine-protein kinase